MALNSCITLDFPYDDLVKFAQYRINQLKISSINAEDLVHIVFCKTLEQNRKLISNKAYLLQGINNTSINIKRRDCARYNPAFKPVEVLEYLAEDTKTILDELLEYESYLINEENKKVIFLLFEKLFEEINASKTIRNLCDPKSNTFFPRYKTNELAKRMNLSPSTITNNLAMIRNNIFPEIRKRFKMYIERNKSNINPAKGSALNTANY